MPRIITALYEDRGAAERALQALIETGTARDRIAIIGEKHATGTEVAPSRPPAPDENVTAALRGLALPGEDMRLFEAGLRRGCALVSVRVDGGDVDRAIQTLEMFDPVDLDRRSQEWLRGGAGATASARSGVDVGEPLGAGLTAGSGQGDTNLESVPGMGTMADNTSGLGTADLRTSEMGLSDQGRSSIPAGGRRAEERAGAPGVDELAAGVENPNPDLHRREMSGIGRVRRYVRGEG
jgi:hypothetical protein